MESQVYLFVGIAAFMFIVIGGISLIAHYYTLNGIKSKTVGDGQHGTARFATKKEIIKAKVEREALELTNDVEKLNDEEALMEIIEKIAREQYKMVKPNETIYIDKNKNDNKLIQGIGVEEELKNN